MKSYILASLGILIMNILDVLYTRDTITYLNGYELNPVSAFILETAGYDGLMTVKVLGCLIIVVAAPIFYRTKYLILKGAFWTLFLFYLGVTIYHISIWSGALGYILR